MIAQQPVPGIPGAVMRRVESLPTGLTDAEAIGTLTHAKPGQLLFTFPGTGTFFARDGQLIEYVDAEGADPGLVSLILHGTARGALIHQRGELPLHAATLVPPDGDGAVAICGRSGAGKSTLAFELTRRGWHLIADDTTRVTWDGQSPSAWPSRDSIKLWKDACEAVSLDVASLERVAREMDKFYVQVPSRHQPVRLALIVELTRSGETAELSIGEKMALVSRHTYRPSHIRPLGVQKPHVEIVARTATACRMIQLPGDRSRTVRALADTVAEELG